MAREIVDPVSPKTSEEALDFVRKMQRAFPKTPRSRKERAALQKYLAQFTDAELRAVGSRLLSDLMQRPPRTINQGDLPPEPVARPESYGATPPTSRPNVRTRTKARAKPKAGPARKRRRARRRPR